MNRATMRCADNMTRQSMMQPDRDSSSALNGARGRPACVRRTACDRRHGRSWLAGRVRGLALLIAVGALFGLAVPLAKVASDLETHPVGLTLWVNLIIGALCLVVTSIRRRWPRLDPATMRFILLWGLYGTVLGEVLIFWIVQYLPASTVSVIIVLEGFMVYLYLLMWRAERVTLLNAVGLGIGLCGVLTVLVGVNGNALAGPLPWIIVAMAIPAIYAAEDLLLVYDMPAGLDVIAGAGLSALAGAVMLLPVAWTLNDFVALSLRPSRLELTILLIAVSSALGSILMVELMTSAGAVFGSQTGYTITCCGVLWSILLLGETPDAWLWLALVTLVIGLSLVEPHHGVRDARS